MSWQELGSHWWALLIAALTGFLGWRVKSAQDSVRLERLREDVGALQKELRDFKQSAESRLGAADVREARLETRLDAIIEALGEIRSQLRHKADR